MHACVLTAHLCAGTVGLDLLDDAGVVLIRLVQVDDGLLLVRSLQGMALTETSYCYNRQFPRPLLRVSEVSAASRDEMRPTCMNSSYFFLPEVSDANWRHVSCTTQARVGPRACCIAPDTGQSKGRAGTGQTRPGMLGAGADLAHAHSRVGGLDAEVVEQLIHLIPAAGPHLWSNRVWCSTGVQMWHVSAAWT